MIEIKLNVGDLVKYDPQQISFTFFNDDYCTRGDIGIIISKFQCSKIFKRQYRIKYIVLFKTATIQCFSYDLTKICD